MYTSTFLQMDQPTIIAYLPSLTAKTPYTDSRLAVLSDGTTIPVLVLLAQQRYGSIPKGQFPFWLDKDPTDRKSVV